MVRSGEWRGTTRLDVHVRRRENDGEDAVVAWSDQVFYSGEERGRETELWHGTGMAWPRWVLRGERARGGAV